MLASEEWQRNLKKVGELARIAEALGTNMARLAIAWCLKNPNVSTVITGASRAEQVRDNMKALDVLPQLTGEVIEKIEDVLGNKPEPMAMQ
jgi:aryl-alcohol dehydrogenase-like predicted oxidoreductase